MQVKCHGRDPDGHSVERDGHRFISLSIKMAPGDRIAGLNRFKLIVGENLTETQQLVMTAAREAQVLVQDHRPVRVQINDWGEQLFHIEYAVARPDTATGEDDFVSRMLWALSDPSGLPAMRFADLNPVPSLDWLKPISEPRFRHCDLIRFRVPPKASLDQQLAFSLTRRPAPYDGAPPMALAGGTMQDSAYDNVMVQFARWLTQHLNNSALLLWLVKQGGRPHGDLSWRIGRRLAACRTWARQTRAKATWHLCERRPVSLCREGRFDRNGDCILAIGR